MNLPAPAQTWVQELRSNRRTQTALAALVLTLGYLLWPAAPRRKAGPSAAPTATAPLDEQRLEVLRKLGDLTQLERAGELPTDGQMYRDLFRFDLPPPPPPPPPKPVPPPPPPPPPTAAELAALKLAQSRQEATNSRPQNLRYLGYMGRASTGRIGSFAKGEEFLSLRVGDLASPAWKLVALTDTYAEFEHQTFPDLRYRAEARDRQGPSGPQAPATNTF